VPDGRRNDLDIRCFPTADDVFRADVQASIARSRETVASGRRLLDAVRRDLAARYPSIAIQPQDPLADFGDDHERWYVYRDGRIA
jgi:hypothetical protein